MKCIACGAEIQPDKQLCPLCMELEHKVQVLTPEEKQEFSGITIEQDQGKQTNDYDDYLDNDEKQRIYVRHVNLGQTGIVTKIILGVIFAGLLVIALPIAILVLSIILFFFYGVRR